MSAENEKGDHVPDRLYPIEEREVQWRYRELFESSVDGIVLVGMDGRILDANRSYQAMLGYSMDELRSMTYQQLTPGRWHPFETYVVQGQVTSKGYTDEHETEHIKKDGTVLPVSVRAWIHKDWQGNIAGTWRIIRPITERKDFDETRSRVEARYRDTLDCLMEGCQVIGTDWRYLYLNNAAVVHGHQSREDLVGHTMMERYPGIERTELFKALRECMENKVHRQLENKFTYPDGTEGWFELRVEPVPEGIFIMSIDITERKKAEMELQEHRQHLARLVEERTRELDHQFRTLQGILESCKDPVFSVDSSLRYTAFNKSHAAMMKALHDANIELGKSVLGYLTGERDRVKVKATFDRALQGERVVEESCTGDDGQMQSCFEVTYNPIKDVDGTAVGVAVFARDIMPEKRLKEMQERVIRQEKLALVGKLAASVSHELRNPLGVISNAIYYLDMKIPKTDETITKHLKLVKDQATRATKIITDLLDFTRIKPGEPRLVCIHDVLNQALALSIIPKHVVVKTDYANDLPGVYCDPMRMQQAFMNIITNAIQAMESGGQLEITTTSNDDIVQVSFKDSGAGIPKENMPRLFEPLFSTKITGIGLGLSIAKEIIEQYQGRIHVESSEGAGTTVVIQLPKGSQLLKDGR
ncbi:MAG: PAS domain S-box protein [Candidatus Sigynarchaeota archaeon]